jgi:hypothetical protein
MSVAQIVAALEAHRDAVGDCYAAGLKRDPLLNGRADITLRFASDGTVGSTEIHMSVEPTVDACIAAVLITAQLSPGRRAPDRSVHVTLVFDAT